LAQELIGIQHNKKGDLWVIVDSVVYDLSKFGNLNPGGIGVLLDSEVGESPISLLYLSSRPLLCRIADLWALPSWLGRDHRLLWPVGVLPILPCPLS